VVPHPVSGRQRERLEFFPCRTEGAELIDRRAGRRERERREWLRQHLVQISFRSDTDRHMRIEPLACSNDEKRAHLTDLKRERLIDEVCIQEILPPEKQ